MTLVIEYFFHSVLRSNGYLKTSFSAAYIVIKLKSGDVNTDCILSYSLLVSLQSVLTSSPNKMGGRQDQINCNTDTFYLYSLFIGKKRKVFHSPQGITLTHKTESKPNLLFQLACG